MGETLEGETGDGVDVSDLPTEVDWRTKDIVTDVKDQKQCGSCWAFSATGSLEGQHGCFGGLMDFAFKYVKDQGGIDTEASYPYTAKTGKKCLYNSTTVGANLTSWVDVMKGSEADLQKAVATVGP